VDKPCISIVAAIGKNRELGRGNRLLWHIPDDLKRFKQLTMGHPVIMGRKTFESIGKPLPGRENLIVSRKGLSLEQALQKAKALDQEEVFVIGGAQIYEQALPYTNRLYLTLIDDSKDADTFFPPYEKIFTKKVSDEPHEKYRFVTLEK
jgi:dihydrofolate reductase